MQGFGLRGGYISVGDECGKQGALFRVIVVDISYILCYVLPFYTTYMVHSYEQERDSYGLPELIREITSVFCNEVMCNEK